MYIPAEQPEYALASVGLESSAIAGRAGLAIVAVSGRDSVAAAIAAVRERGLTLLLPVSVATGTEYGDEQEPVRTVERLRAALGDEATLLPYLRLGSPRMWAALNGRFASEIAARYHVSSPCLACHLYIHLTLVPLAQLLGSAPIVAGERDARGGRVKLSQTPLGIDAEVRVLARAGIELLEPIRRIRDSETIAQIAGPAWPASARRLCCVHSGNYVGLDGEVVYDQLAYARYVHGFLEPAGGAIVDAWRETPEPNYEAIVHSVLEGPEAA
jgi:hypothetical protein